MPTVLLVAHPHLSTSRANRALITSVTDMADLEVVDLYSLYDSRGIDADAEQERLLRATRLVLQFPLYWYSTPPLLKGWADAVLTPLFYLRPEIADTTAGLPLLAATTTGGPWDSYRPGGATMTIDDLFAPLRATASKCAWIWQPPFAVHDVRNLDDSGLLRAGSKYRSTISRMPQLDRTGGRTRL